MKSDFAGKSDGSAEVSDPSPQVSAEQRVAALVSEDRVLEALEVAHEAECSMRSGVLEEKLVQLRLDAVRQLDTHPPAEWPPAVEDLFPGAEEPVTLTPDEVDSRSLNSAIQHHGALRIKGLVPAQKAEWIAELMDKAFSAYDQWREGQPWKKFSPDLAPFDASAPNPEIGMLRSIAREGGAILTADLPRMLSELLQAYEAAGLVHVVEQYFGERPVLSARKSLMRRVPPDLPLAEWHQDGAFLKRGQQLRTLNVWMSLSHCGGHTLAPGMEIVPGRLDHIVETGTGGTIFDWTVGHKVVEEIMQSKPVLKPEFEPGDVLLFDEYNLHRTATGPGLKRPRYAMESWFFSPSYYPPHHMPILV